MNKIDHMGCFYKESPSFLIDRPEGSGNWLLLHFQTEIYIMTNNTESLYEPGTVILYSPDHHQRYHHLGNGFINDWLHFNSETITSYIASIGFPLNTPMTCNDVNLIQGLFTELENEHLMRDRHHEIKTDLMIKQMLIEIQRNVTPLAHNLNATPHASDLRKLRSKVLSSLDEPWTIENMAQEITLSRSRFSHLYAELFGKSPKADLQEARIQMAKYLLKSQNQPVSQVAERVGFDNIYHFSKQFKIATGLSPRAYRIYD